MIEAIKKRRAIRQYLDEKVSDEKLNEIISAAMYAPSANAIYPWDLIIIKNNETKEKLSKVTPWSGHVKDAQVVIAVVGHETESPDWVEDCSIAAEHIWLEATDQGLGACWVQIRGNENAQKEVKELLSVPDEHRVLCLIPIGVIGKAEEEHSEDDFDRTRIKQESY
ncbi:nitroreductase [Candidatus Falkowbacteria bacterium]|uniref:Nitroreductase n=1 Tax=Candidatus Buchananbacteria bacterium CG10_big_fil_rev_8_21_14_0_10_33_19 TaxID=1974525 RepID=A0A2H0W725_9BACT|nr:nitroreductase [Candidatus Falkowbacteria bacterium]PIS06430.1 MAG: nitroreductase [Candidatus Buchananbacteria bacterium CG10_big_fil_rev_8_21_14_0_10_33_19]